MRNVYAYKIVAYCIYLLHLPGTGKTSHLLHKNQLYYHWRYLFYIPTHYVRAKKAKPFNSKFIYLFSARFSIILCLRILRLWLVGGLYKYDYFRKNWLYASYFLRGMANCFLQKKRDYLINL